MIKWTTPTLECNITPIGEFDYLIVTFATPSTKIEKRIPYAAVDEEGNFTITFTQEETGQLQVGINVAAQCNVIVGNKRLGTNEEYLRVARNLKDEAIEI